MNESKLALFFTAIKNFLLVKKGAEGFRTFHGVFLPSILSILGVILYLRLGTILGEIGFLSTISIICLATSITLITALSISASSTNMFVGRGGTYFIISRSFGVNIGSAIGISLYLAQAIGIAFYIMGFAESVHYLIPWLSLDVIEFSTLVTLGIISIISTKLVMRTQLLIFFLVMLSLISFYMGIEATEQVETNTPFVPTVGYWAAFALFFPAVTGLESGVSMSGELRNPRRSLPIGTVSAVIMGLLIYLSIVYLLWIRVPRSLLLSDTMIIEHTAWCGPLIIIGIFGATLSSALGAILAAPRTLQAIADDKVIHKIIGKEFGKDKEPRIASAITLAIAGLCLYLGDLDFLAPILTMFFLISYGILNLATGLESLMNNPSWRPTISIPAYISIGGTCLCMMAMLLIDAGATLISLFLVSLIYLLLTRKLKSGWDDIRKGILLFLSRYVILRLATTQFSPKSWRPNVLTYSKNLIPHPFLLDFVSSITEEKGFLTFLHSHNTDGKTFNQEKSLTYCQSFLKKNKVEAIVDFFDHDYIKANLKNIFQTYGFGPLRPNTLVMNLTDDNDYNLLFDNNENEDKRLDKNLILLKVKENYNSTIKKPRRIDIWWNNELSQHNDLMILIAHMYCHGKKNADVEIQLNVIAPDEIAKKHLTEFFTNYLTSSRLNMKHNVYVCPNIETETFKIIAHFSADAFMTFVGIERPNESKDIDTHKNYINNILEETKALNSILLFQSHSQVPLSDIINPG